jgi:hypothetical protein
MNKDIQTQMHKPLSLFILLYFFSSFQFLVFLSKYCTVDIQVLLAYCAKDLAFPPPENQPKPLLGVAKIRMAGQRSSEMAGEGEYKVNRYFLFSLVHLKL